MPKSSPSRRTISFELTESSPTSAPTLFALVADGSRWSEWARPLVTHSSWARTGSPEPAGVGAIRSVGSGPLRVKEETVAYEQDRLHAYTLRIPAPLRDYRAEVRLTPRPDGGTDVAWQVRFTELVPGSGPVVRAGLRKLIGYLIGKLVAVRETKPRSVD